MNRPLLSITLLTLSMAACQSGEDFHGIWHETVCQSSPCLPKAKLHLGQYGNAIAGVVAWVRSQENIDTFDTPSFECGCEYIQAGSVRDDRLTLTTYPLAECSAQELCNPCACDNYTLEVKLTTDDLLVGNVICMDGTQHSVEFVRALGTPKSGCALNDD